MAYSQLALNLINAFLIVIVIAVFAGIIANIAKRIVKGSGLNSWIAVGLGINSPVEKIISEIVRYAIYIFGLIVILKIMGISGRIIWEVLLIFFGIIILLLLLMLKDVVPNIMAGMYIKRTKKIRIGETIKVKGVEGKILGIKLLETKIAAGKEIIFVPNSVLVKEEIIKH